MQGAVALTEGYAPGAPRRVPRFRGEGADMQDEGPSAGCGTPPGAGSGEARRGNAGRMLSRGLLGLLLGASALSPALAASVPLPPSRPVMERDGRDEAAAKRDRTAPQEAAQEAARAGTRPPAGRATTARGSGSPTAKGAVPLPMPRPPEIAASDPDEAEPVEMASASSAPQADAPSGTGFPPLVAPPSSAPGPSATTPETRRYEPTGTGEGLPAACAALVQQGLIAAEPERGLSVPSPCTLAEPVRFSGIRLNSGALIDLKPAAVVGCGTVAAVAEWVREDLAPAMEEMGTSIVAVKVAASFACRSQNNLRGTRISEHGFGRALDVGGFELANHSQVEVKNGGLPVAFQEKMRESACARFMTVLGPGSDGFHEDHIHVDLAKRREAYKLCRWRIKGATPTLTAQGRRP